MKKYLTIEDTIGATPLVRLQRIPGEFGEQRGNVILAKLEGNNPAGSVKDRAASAMIRQAEARGDIKPGDTLIEATSGNTGIALAMTAAVRGYKMILIMPDNLTVERRASMTAYGAELILTPASQGGMEYARDLAEKMQAEGIGQDADVDGVRGPEAAGHVVERGLADGAHAARGDGGRPAVDVYAHLGHGTVMV